VEIPDKISRVIVLSRDMLEVARALDTIPLVVGVGDTVKRDPTFWPELAKAPVVGKWNDPNYEAIAALKPDLVLTYGRNPGPEAEDRLRSVGIPLLRLEVHQISHFEAVVRTLGEALDRKPQAEALLAWWTGKYALLDACLGQGLEPRRVYLEGYNRLQAWGAGSSGDETLRKVRGQNVAQSLGAAFGEVNPEWVLATQPWAIVKFSSSKERYVAETREALRKVALDIAARPGFDQLEAVRNERVFVLAAEVHGGPRAPVGAAYLARWLYPDRCADCDPDRWHKEYFERFQRMPYQGAFAWPALTTAETGKP
jgi:iron complex transport system substrate-binding protein